MNPTIDPTTTADVSPGRDQPNLCTTIELPKSDLQIAQDAWKQLMHTSPPTLIPQPLQRPLSMTIANTRANNPWGDDLSQAEIQGHLRVYVSNVNGLRLDERGGQFDTLCKIRADKNITLTLPKWLFAQSCTRQQPNTGNDIVWSSARRPFRSHRIINRVAHSSSPLAT